MKKIDPTERPKHTSGRWDVRYVERPRARMGLWSDFRDRFTTAYLVAIKSTNPTAFERLKAMIARADEVGRDPEGWEARA